MYHVQCAGKRELRSTLQDVHEPSAWFYAGSKWTKENIKQSGDEADWPSNDDQDKEPHDRPAKTRAASHLLLE